MKHSLIIALLLALTAPLSAQWQSAGNRIQTRWAQEVDPQNPLPEYPRPIMERPQWVNLNGLWDYAILPVGERPSDYQGKILVPFAVESSLSGVGRKVGDRNELWYHRTFSVPQQWKGQRIILHFGAIDWRSDIWVNEIKVGSHTGGYSPFEFDITDALVKGDNSIVIKVWDPSDKGYQPRGKQVGNPRSIWYTSVTGIWQTVWMEPVPEHNIRNVRITPDLDRKLFLVEAITSSCEKSLVEVQIIDNGRVVASGKSVAGQKAEIYVADPKLWSPDSPFLYDVTVSLLKNGKIVDAVRSYAAMRKFSYGKDENGICRMLLNNKPLFQFGPLDQGWWPDGLYTAPTDKALEFDIKTTKDLGFNMIRKHVKVEPARWYYHCDRLGMIVWQDMPSGDKSPRWNMTGYFTETELDRTPESESNYRREWREIMDYLYSYPCIGVWVPFNEGWGQFKTREIAGWTKTHDPSRLVNPASGGNHFTCGDILDLHHYPDPDMYLYDATRVTVLGEYGGIGWPVAGHLWEPDRNWGYIAFNSSEDMTSEYLKYAEQLLQMIQRGFSAAVYTQTTDVEIEVNGLMTYDRAIIKPDQAKVKEINTKICNSLK
ncbi:MAG: glycoside hydrolase family 2 TIM barrel-domain containing protein [Bacteroidales bacterium]|nr:glycoside hydrolase family 2 TIM barrel-domain containing protein [Bacteroidales bacterium]MDD4669672.1 glycoside hydrolase family 2 TIM barrel-domain containing protein [Bacteroidales bacterium]